MFKGLIRMLKKLEVSDDVRYREYEKKPYMIDIYYRDTIITNERLARIERSSKNACVISWEIGILDLSDLKSEKFLNVITNILRVKAERLYIENDTELEECYQILRNLFYIDVDSVVAKNHLDSNEVLFEIKNEAVETALGLYENIDAFSKTRLMFLQEIYIDAEVLKEDNFDLLLDIVKNPNLIKKVYITSAALDNSKALERLISILPSNNITLITTENRRIDINSDKEIYVENNNLSGNMFDGFTLKEYNDVMDMMDEISAFADINDLNVLERLILIYDILKGGEYYRENSVYECSSSSNAYSALLQKNSICEGYARTMDALGKKLGIDISYISMYAKNGGHSYNLVRIDGKIYVVDVTSDLYVTEEDGVISEKFRYILKPYKDYRNERIYKRIRGFDESFFDESSVYAEEEYDITEIARAIVKIRNLIILDDKRLVGKRKYYSTDYDEILKYLSLADEKNLGEENTIVDMLLSEGILKLLRIEKINAKYKDINKHKNLYLCESMESIREAETSEDITDEALINDILLGVSARKDSENKSIARFLNNIKIILESKEIMVSGERLASIANALLYYEEEIYEDAFKRIRLKYDESGKFMLIREGEAHTLIEDTLTGKVREVSSYSETAELDFNIPEDMPQCEDAVSTLAEEDDAECDRSEIEA